MRYGVAVVLLHVVSIAEGQATLPGMLLSWQRERKMADHAMAFKAYTWTQTVPRLLTSWPEQIIQPVGWRAPERYPVG